MCGCFFFYFDLININKTGLPHIEKRTCDFVRQTTNNNFFIENISIHVILCVKYYLSNDICVWTPYNLAVCSVSIQCLCVNVCVCLCAGVRMCGCENKHFQCPNKWYVAPLIRFLLCMSVYLYAFVHFAICIVVVIGFAGFFFFLHITQWYN